MPQVGLVRGAQVRVWGEGAMKTSELEGAALDAAVAKAEGIEVVAREEGGLSRWDQDHGHWRGWNPSTDWRDGGPIIEREVITLVASSEFDGKGPLGWSASVGPYSSYIDEQLPFSSYDNDPPVGHGATPLIAAMRAYVTSQFGDEVDLP